MTETVFSAGKPSRPRHECFAVLGKWRGGPQSHGLPEFGGKPSDLRRSTPKKQDSNFAFRGPFSQLGNPPDLGVSVLRPSEIGGEVRKNLTVFGLRCHLSAGFQQCQSFVEMGTVRFCPLGRRTASPEHADFGGLSSLDALVVVRLVVVPFPPRSPRRRWRVGRFGLIFCWT